MSLRLLQQCFKASETLLGIETHTLLESAHRNSRFKASETLLGIETKGSLRKVWKKIASKPLKPF